MDREEKPRANSQPAGPLGALPPAVEAHTSMPTKARARGARLWGLAGALSIALAAGWHHSASVTRSPVTSAAPEAFVKNGTELVVAMKDLDYAATRNVRERAKKGSVVSAAPGTGPSRVVRAPAAPLPPDDPIPSPSPLAPAAPPVATEPMATFTQQAALEPPTADAIEAGTMALFTMRVVALDEALGDDTEAIDVAIDGILVGRVTLRNGGGTLTLPLKPGGSFHVLTVTGAEAGRRYHDICFRIESSAGTIGSRGMRAGQVLSWPVTIEP